MTPSVKIKIADIVFKINCESPKPVLWLKKNYELFLTKDKPDLSVDLKLSARKREVSKAYRIKWKHSGRLLIEAGPFDLDIDFPGKKAYVRADNDLGPADLMRFLGFIMLCRRKGLLLHASAVLDKGFSYVFFGPSESGKTTIARLSQARSVLSDEAVAITGGNGEFKAYATPFAGEFGSVKENTGGPVKAVFLIVKAKRFSHRIVGQKEALKELLRNNLVNIPDPVITNHLLDTLTLLVKEVPCYRLYFKPQKAIWRYIHGFVK
ncbi:MAG: hypothetical protein PHN57_05140 [Candidatus Omnitrophica bacterium]|nr:hypothetical protein [Candidatus Omnitrophota bacterium]